MADFRLQRVAVSDRGAFGVLLQGDEPFAVTLERVFEERGQRVPVIPPGDYRCKRTVFYGGRPAPYATYEIAGVKNHDRLLFHVGNYERDTEGCVVVAKAFEGTWVSGSRAGFETFMSRAGGSEEIRLRIDDPSQNGDDDS